MIRSQLFSITDTPGARSCALPKCVGFRILPFYPQAPVSLSNYQGQYPIFLQPTDKSSGEKHPPLIVADGAWHVVNGNRYDKDPVGQGDSYASFYQPDTAGGVTGGNTFWFLFEYTEDRADMVYPGQSGLFTPSAAQGDGLAQRVASRAVTIFDQTCASGVPIDTGIVDCSGFTYITPIAAYISGTTGGVFSCLLYTDDQTITISLASAAVNGTLIVGAMGPGASVGTQPTPLPVLRKYRWQLATPAGSIYKLSIFGR